ncbi:multi-copper enzyme maturation ABC transporter permease [Nostoc linckia z18]|uniref:Multi-copper enzyme maturation ABC transporter permease n=2 Tax=Nostoc linckia TaxID=92942 RepID=A0A9Q5Z786_NOSLI|nr:ABC transporter permease [Nostoc linckia]PHK20855.1 multi-copper enzyme maturation ABC transporter permease [Nostoc linckia z15]PHK47539.1 multi-copper enzyme maturation ABC transporter permease [Nostoc linckia z16]PHJ56331.1 multi-copper enzyme maturation ABC transporter permease [Nostoc linckia z1]PHJ58273.1 multi-copper enzyme maturation ABC transporter permease [Nostoc linckia z3]PHJ61020.1 multi-copper enzyme maturation ABC transporter permease [Nostoc linckia z2]
MTTKIFVLAKNVFQEVIRDRILYIIGFYALILAVAFRALPEFAAATEDKIFLDFGMAAMNAIALIVTIFVGTGLVNKEIEKRTILVLIAKPVSRSEIIVGKYLGLSAVVAVMIATMTAIYLLFLQFGNITHPTVSILIAAIFLFLQLSLITAVAIAFGVFTASLVATILTFAVYLMGNITQDLVQLGRLSRNVGIERLTQGLFLVLPDLSRLDLKNQAVYGLQALPETTALIINAGYGLLYSAMLLAIAIFVFSRREF